jgi:hypothetical protein
MNRERNQSNRYSFKKLILKGVRPISNVTSHSVILVGMITSLLVWAGLPPTGIIQVGAYGGLPQISEQRSLQTDSVKIYLPRISNPALCLNGNTVELVVEAPDDASNWQAALWREYRSYPLNIGAIEYDGIKGRWSLNASIPSSTSPDLYDLHINLTTSAQILSLTEWNAIGVYHQFPTSFSLLHVSDPHLEATPSERDVRFQECLYHGNVLGADLVIITGDLAETESDAVYTRFKIILRTSRVPTFCCPGNHDLGTGNETYCRHFGPEYYTVTFGEIFLIIANTHDEGYFGTAQVNRIEQDLMTHSSAQLKILAFHHPIWEAYIQGSQITPVINPSMPETNEIRRICYEQGVSAVFYGHQHLDLVVLDNGTRYIMTAAIGALPYSLPIGGYWGYRLIQIKNYELQSWCYPGSDPRCISQPIAHQNGSLSKVIKIQRSPTNVHDIQPGLFHQIDNHRETALMNTTIDVLLTPLADDHYVAAGANLVSSINASHAWFLRLNCTIAQDTSTTLRIFPSRPAAPHFGGARLPTPYADSLLSFNANFTNPTSGVHFAELHYSLNNGPWIVEKMLRQSLKEFTISIGPFSGGDHLALFFQAYDYSQLSNNSTLYNLDVLPSSTLTIFTPESLLILGLVVAISIGVTVPIIVLVRRHRKQ